MRKPENHELKRTSEPPLPSFGHAEAKDGEQLSTRRTPPTYSEEARRAGRRRECSWHSQNHRPDCQPDVPQPGPIEKAARGTVRSRSSFDFVLRSFDLFGVEPRKNGKRSEKGAFTLIRKNSPAVAGFGAQVALSIVTRRPCPRCSYVTKPSSDGRVMLPECDVVEAEVTFMGDDEYSGRSDWKGSAGLGSTIMLPHPLHPGRHPDSVLAGELVLATVAGGVHSSSTPHQRHR